MFLFGKKKYVLKASKGGVVEEIEEYDRKVGVSEVAHHIAELSEQGYSGVYLVERDRRGRERVVWYKKLQKSSIKGIKDQLSEMAELMELIDKLRGGRSMDEVLAELAVTINALKQLLPVIAPQGQQSSSDFSDVKELLKTFAEASALSQAMRQQLQQAGAAVAGQKEEVLEKIDKARIDTLSNMCIDLEGSGGGKCFEPQG